MFYHFLSTFINLFINFINFINCVINFINFFYQLFYQLYQLFLTFFSSFYQLAINFVSAVCQHFINTWLISCCFIWKYPNLCSSLTLCYFAWTCQELLVKTQDMTVWCFCDQGVVVNVCASPQFAVVRPPTQLLGRSCCYWELVPLCQSHFLQ